MVKAFSLGLEIICDIPQALSARELADQHGHELAPAVVRAEFLSRVMDFGVILKIMSRNKRGDLVKDCAIMRHGSDLLVLNDFFVETIITQRALRASFY